jgi:hypothetical protein
MVICGQSGKQLKIELTGNVCRLPLQNFASLPRSKFVTIRNSGDCWYGNIIRGGDEKCIAGLALRKET